MTPKYKGIDVSKHQGTINWDQLAADPNVQFVIIRAGYGSYYPAQVDAQFETNYKQAKAHNIPVGVYWYSYASTVSEVHQEMAALLKAIAGKQFEYPVYFDQEYEKDIVVLTKAQKTELVKTALGILEGKGYYAALYCSADWLNNRLNYNQLTSYDMWIAQYGTNCSAKLPYGMWQYSSKGKVNGISTNVDLDYCYKDYPSIIKKAGLNGYKKNSSVIPSTSIAPAVSSTDYVLDWPLQGQHVITAGWYYSAGSLHQAIDLRVAFRQPVYAAGAGVVNFVYTWNGRVTNGDTNSYGNCVKILHDKKYNGKNVETLYAHLDSYIVSKGQRVTTGQLIGYAGYTGHVIPTGPNGKHLHFEVRLSGKRTNPLVWLDADFTTKNSSVYTFGKGERSAIRSTEPSKPTIPTQPSIPQKTITFKDGRWNVRKGPGMEYGIVGQITSPQNGKSTCINYSEIKDQWYKTVYGYVGPAAIKSHT